MSSRRIEDLSIELQHKYAEFKALMEQAGIDFIVTCTYRSQEEQDRLWAQGRTVPGKRATWTRSSRHTARTAFDIAIVKNGKVTWDVRDYFKPGEIAKGIGLTWGGSWKKPDYVHFQLGA